MEKSKLTLKTSILKEMFEIAPKRFQERDLNNHILAKKFHISGKDLKDNIDFLVETGLIQRFPGASYKEDKILDWLITEKGLDYLEKKAAEENQNKFNRIVALNGAILALIGIYTVINNLDFTKSKVILALAILILIAIAIGPIVTFILDSYPDFLKSN